MGAQNERRAFGKKKTHIDWCNILSHSSPHDPVRNWNIHRIYLYHSDDQIRIYFYWQKIYIYIINFCNTNLNNVSDALFLFSCQSRKCASVIFFNFFQIFNFFGNIIKSDNSTNWSARQGNVANIFYYDFYFEIFVMIFRYFYFLIL